MSAASDTAGRRAASDVAALLKAKNCLIWVVTREEARTERLLFEACASANYSPVCWDVGAGLTSLTGNAVDANLTDPSALLAKISQSSERQVAVARALPDLLEHPG